MLLLHSPILFHSSVSLPSSRCSFGNSRAVVDARVDRKLDVQAERIHDRRKTWEFSLSLVPPQGDRIVNPFSEV